jgi:hypothetical protein
MDLLAKIAATALKLETVQTAMRATVSDAEMVRKMNTVARLRAELRALETRRDLILGR